MTTTTTTTTITGNVPWRMQHNGKREQVDALKVHPCKGSQIVLAKKICSLFIDRTRVEESSREWKKRTMEPSNTTTFCTSITTKLKISSTM
jgi:hypothetical protein